MFWRFARGARRFLKRPLTAEDCRRIVADAQDKREANFLLLLRLAIYGNQRSPYRKLLEHAGIEYGDVEADVRANGVEAATARLYDAGIRISLDEFKGKKAIERPGLTVPVQAEDFDNPVLTRDFELLSSGSTGARRRMAIDLEMSAYESAVRLFYLEAGGITDEPIALWRAVPPAAAGLKYTLRAAKIGRPVKRWFSPTRVSWSREMLPSAVFLGTALAAGRTSGAIPTPEYAPLSDPEPLADWLQEGIRSGARPMLSLPVSSGVHVASTGRDLGGSIFELGGEAITAAKARRIEACGGQVVSNYSLTETGPIGIGCWNRMEVDEVHFVESKLVVHQRPVATLDGSEVAALFLTTLHPSTPKLMLNVDAGDYGVIPSGSCGCPLERLGAKRLHTIRSYEKLTAGGMHFIGGDVLTLLEETLPQRHGGGAGDYQLEECERDGVSWIGVVVSRRVALRDEDRVPETVLEFLSNASRAGRMMADQWRQGGTLEVIRKEPHVTAAGKTPPIRVAPR